MKQVTVFIRESLNHSLNWFIQKTESFKNVTIVLKLLWLRMDFFLQNSLQYCVKYKLLSINFFVDLLY